jgi:hypothetical protein
MLTLHNIVAIGVFESANSIYSLKTKISSIQNCKFGKDCFGEISMMAKWKRLKTYSD